MSDSDKKTGLFDVHKQMGAKLIPFGGWIMPVEYSGIASEHTAVRTTAGLFDVSHMGEFEVTGPRALDLLQYLTSNDVSRLVDGQAHYSSLLTPDGTIIDDLLVYRRSSEHFMVVVNAANTEKDFAWMSANNVFGAPITDVSSVTTLLALQGPRALEILRPLTDQRLEAIPCYHFARGKVTGIDALISRTGYTGEDGFELYFGAPHSQGIWSALLEAGKPFNLRPAGLGARNTLRLEAKLLLHGSDIDETTSPLEAGLGWIAKLDKPDFIGRDALKRQQAIGPNRMLVGFEMLGKEIARDHYPVRLDGQEVAHVTSGSPSITLRKNIGLTYLPVERSGVGTRFEVIVRGRAAEAQVVETPFYKRKTS